MTDLTAGINRDFREYLHLVPNESQERKDWEWYWNVALTCDLTMRSARFVAYRYVHFGKSMTTKRNIVASTVGGNNCTYIFLEICVEDGDTSS